MVQPVRRVCLLVGLMAQSLAATCQRDQRRRHLPQRGASMIEFTLAMPVITLLGLAMLQYGMLFFAKNQINHAAFMAARAGAMGNASLDKVQQAYITALIPMVGGGQNAAALGQSLGKARDLVTGTNQFGQNPQGGYARITLLNPTSESFTDWNSTTLQQTIGKGSQVIPNSGQAFKSPAVIKPLSGQSIQDANLIKLRILHGYQPKIPLMGAIYNRYLGWMDSKTDAVQTDLIARGLIPVETQVTLQMQSDAIQGQTVSSPGMGNNGNPVDPGTPPAVTTDPPACGLIGCPPAPTPPDTLPPCNPMGDANGCLPPGCTPGDISCDPICNRPDLCCIPADMKF